MNSETEKTCVEDTITKLDNVRNQVNVLNNTIHNQTINIKDEPDHVKYPIQFHLSNPVRSFHGRDEELAKLVKYFSENKFVVVSGMAGIGKSDITKHYAITNRDLHGNNLIWINAENSDTLKNSFQDLGKILRIRNDFDLQSLVQAIYSSFKDKHVLFIFDNAQNRRNLHHYFPSSINQDINNIKIMISSQNANWGSDIPTLKLNILSIENALKIFKNVLNESYREEEEEHFTELAKVLNCIPLALQIAAAYLNENIRIAKQNDDQFVVKNYVERLKNGEHKLLDESFPENTENDYSKTIYIAVEFSLENIIKSSKKEAQQALNMLYYCSYLNSDSITKRDLELLGFGNNLNNILSILSDYSFVYFDEEKRKTLIGQFFDKTEYLRIIRLHRLIQWTLRVYQKRNKIENEFYERLLDMLVSDDASKYYYNFSLSHSGTICKYSTENAEICLKYYQKYKPKLFIFYVFKSKCLHLLHLLVRYNCHFTLGKIFVFESKFKVLKLIRKLNLLHVAAKYGHISIIELILSYKESINAQDYIKNTPLHDASLCLHHDVILWLIKAGANTNARNSKKHTPLHRILLNFFRDESVILKCVKLLVDEGNANVNLKTDSGETPLHLAAENSFESVIEFLIERGADVNAKDKLNRTALFYLSPVMYFDDTKKINTARLLVEKGADIYLRDNFGLTAADFARCKRLRRLANYLNPNTFDDQPMLMHE